MNHSSRWVLAGMALLALPPIAGGDGITAVFARLQGYREVPSVSSPASGVFRATIDDQAGSIAYRLSFQGLTGDVRQAHIHFGQQSVNGAITVFLCQTATNPDPTGLAPQCPQSGTVTGLIQAANMVPAAAGQGLSPGDFAELLAAIRAGVAYVNVHSSTFGGGEVRGQIRGD